MERHLTKEIKTKDEPPPPPPPPFTKKVDMTFFQTDKYRQFKFVRVILQHIEIQEIKKQ